MDAIGTIQATVVPTLTARSQSAPVLPKSSGSSLPQPSQADAELNAKIAAAQQRRFEAVRSAAQVIANANVLGTTTFSLYQVDGQLVTRFTDTQTGKVTYIPEQRMIELAGSKAAPTVTIEA